MVEIFVGIITSRAIRRGTFTSAKDLENAISIDMDGWNQRYTLHLDNDTADHLIEHARPGKRAPSTHFVSSSVTSPEHKSARPARLETRFTRDEFVDGEPAP